MNMWGFLTALAGVIASAAFLSKVLRRSEPGIEGVLVRGGRFQLNKHTEIPLNKRDGVDNAKIQKNRFGLVAWPWYEWRPVSVADRTYAIDIPFDFWVNDAWKNFVITLQPTWGVIPSEPNGINYAARSERNAKNGIDNLTQAVLRRAFNRLLRQEGVTLEDLADSDFLYEHLRNLVEIVDDVELAQNPNSFPLSHYGCELRGMASVLTRSQMQVYNDNHGTDPIIAARVAGVVSQ